jgi:hypothetical protein
MGRREITTVTLLLASTLITGAGATGLDREMLWQPGWQCGKETTISKKLVKSLQESGFLRAYKLHGAALPILLGQDPEGLGAILFVQKQGKWHNYPIASGGMVLTAYSTPSYNRIMLFSTWGNQGPGNDYIVLHGKHQLGEFACTTVHFPAELNRPDRANQYPGLHDFNMDKKGQGTLLTADYLTESGRETKHWYRYTSSDWGINWNEAKPATIPTAKLPGIFTPIQQIKAPPAMVKTLLQSAH